MVIRSFWTKVRSKIDDVPNEKLSDNEKKRLKLVIDELVSIGFVNGSIAAEIIGVSASTARRLLSKSEKLDVLKSEGSTGNKKYFLNNWKCKVINYDRTWNNATRKELYR